MYTHAFQLNVAKHSYTHIHAYTDLRTDTHTRLFKRTHATKHHKTHTHIHAFTNAHTYLYIYMHSVHTRISLIFLSIGYTHMHTKIFEQTHAHTPF